jgi:adenylate cyclase
MAKIFNDAINLYLDRKFEEAITVFALLYQQGDKPSLTYIDRCNIFIKNPPDENWD